MDTSNNLANLAYKAIADQNKISQERFIKIFGSLSAYVLEFLKGDGYKELLGALYDFYLKDDKERLLQSTIFTINLDNPEELKKLNDLKLEFQGREEMFKNLEDLKEAIKEVRVI
jgi:hypothetical protein